MSEPTEGDDVICARCEGSGNRIVVSEDGHVRTVVACGECGGIGHHPTEVESYEP